MIAGRVIGKFLTPSLALAAAAVVLLPTSRAMADQFVDLSDPGTTSGKIDAVVGGTALFTRVSNIPTGTGVFDPFLTIDNTPIEQGYNTSADNLALPLDDLRNHWNHDVQLGQLATVTVGADSYYVFDLDANETGIGSDRKYLSIDNIRVYTSQTGGQTTSDLSQLGQLRFALNDPNTPATIMPNWVKIDATIGLTSGSGSDDMLAYIPTKAFAGASDKDYVVFYNLNGVHYQADDGTSSDAGFEEWSALTGPSSSVPDGGNTLALMGSALATLGFVAGRRKMAISA